MPVYEYECPDCGELIERYFKIEDKPNTVACNNCGGTAVKILSAGLVLGDDMPAWMRHEQALGCLQPATERPITTRGEYNAYLKKKGISEVSMSREI